MAAIIMATAANSREGMMMRVSRAARVAVSGLKLGANSQTRAGAKMMPSTTRTAMTRAVKFSRVLPMRKASSRPPSRCQQALMAGRAAETKA